MIDATIVTSGDFLYTSKQVCQELNIASSTLRTWCLRLEASGHSFYRERKRADNASDVGIRMFYERDITALRKMKKLLQDGYSLEKATEQTLLEYTKLQKPMTAPVMPNDASREVAAAGSTLPSEHRDAAELHPLLAQLELLDEIPGIIETMDEQRKKNEQLMEMVRQLTERQEELIKHQASQKEQYEEQRARIEQRDRLLMETLRELRKPWWKRLRL